MNLESKKYATAALKDQYFVFCTPTGHIQQLRDWLKHQQQKFNPNF